MEDKIQTGEGISLLEIIRLLLSKIKLLILVVVIGGILGGALSVWKTMDVNYWGTRVEFYINPEPPEDTTDLDDALSGGSQYGVYGSYGKRVMDNMIKLLSSESFLEQLLLDGDLLPDKNVWLSEVKDAELKASLETAIDAANADLKKVEIKETVYNSAVANRN